MQHQESESQGKCRCERQTGGTGGVKLLILGYTESGKTTAAEILADALHTTYLNTSDQLIKEFAEQSGIPQATIIENKQQYRDQLFALGMARQESDPLWPQDVQLRTADILTGARNPNEIQAARSHNLYDLIIWIDRPGYTAGNTDKLTPADADCVIINDGSIEELREKLLSTLAGRLASRPTG